MGERVTIRTERQKQSMLGVNSDGLRHRDDFYPTPVDLTQALLAVETFEGGVWEPACGDGAISKELAEAGVHVESSDLVNRGFGAARRDFLMEWAMCPGTRHVVTNPPFKLGGAFWKHACQLAPGKVAFLMRLTWLEGQTRARLFREHPLARVWVCPWRPKFQRGRQATKDDAGSMLAFAWFIRDPAHQGPPTLGWLPDTRIAHVSGQDAPLFAGAAT